MWHDNSERKSHITILWSQILSRKSRIWEQAMSMYENMFLVLDINHVYVLLPKIYSKNDFNGYRFTNHLFYVMIYLNCFYWIQQGLSSNLFINAYIVVLMMNLLLYVWMMLFYLILSADDVNWPKQMCFHILLKLYCYPEKLRVLL